MLSYHRNSDDICTVESRLSRRLSLRLSPTGLDLGLMQAELLETPAGLDAPPAAAADPAQATPSTLALFSTFTLTVCRLRADGGGRSPKSCRDKLGFSWFCSCLQMTHNVDFCETTYNLMNIKGTHLMVTFSSVSRRKRSSWWSCGSLELDFEAAVVSAGLEGGSFLISTWCLFIPSSTEVEVSLGLLSWSSRCRILCRSVRVLCEAGH